MATCWSIFLQNLTGSDFEYGHDLTTLGRYFRLYSQWMAHWRKVLPEGMLIELDYESLVRDQDAQTRALLAACDLPWDAQCLDFHRSFNRVQTASAMQVRQPMYRDANQAWRNYQEHLQPLSEALGDEAFGKPA